MARQIKGREYGLEFGLIGLNFLFKSKALHYGYWTSTDEVNLWNFGKAQENYTRELVDHVPEDATDILDVGCGTGVVARCLMERGHRLECLSPSPFLNAEARKTLPDSVQIHQTRFEDFDTDKTYDLVLFAESFQYANMEESFARCLKFLKPGGRVLICDVFKLDTPGKSPIGGGHNYRKYLGIRDSFGLTCVQDVDITAHIAPTFDLVQDASLNLLKPSWENFLRIVQTNHPFISKLLIWKFRKKLQKMEKHFRADRNAEGFNKYKTYRIQLLAPSGNGHPAATA